ncbi:MAG TPA: lytic transglycosylase domain-containing protein [Burkholderiales bacterium]|nr:lytic transglycosylase domain-containing protein [Burkholderiales bacterium]
MSRSRECARASLPAIALALVSAAFSGQADSQRRGDLYKFTDEAGVPRLTNLPYLDSRYKLAYPARREPMVVAAPRVPRREDIARYTPIIEAAARKAGVDPLLLHAVIRAESGYNAAALSVKGASGLMQLLPVTAKRYGVKDLFDPRENVEAGARYLKDLLGLFDNNLELAIAGYNAGEGSVMRAGNKVPNYRETLAYVPKVLEFYRAARDSDAWP